MTKQFILSFILFCSGIAVFCTQVAVADEIQLSFLSPVGSKTTLGGNALSLLEVVRNNEVDFNRLFPADNYFLQDVKIEVLAPKEETYSNTLRYTFTSAPQAGIAVPDPKQKTQRLIIDSSYDRTTQDDYTIEYKSSGVHPINR